MNNKKEKMKNTLPTSERKGSTKEIFTKKQQKFKTESKKICFGLISFLEPRLGLINYKEEHNIKLGFRVNSM